MNLAERFSNLIGAFNVFSVIDIIVLAVFYAYVFIIAKKYNSRYYMVLTVAFLLVALIASVLGLPATAHITKAMLALYPLMCFVLFRTEIRREIWKKSAKAQLGESPVTTFSGSEEEIHECIGVIIKACQSMSKRNVGALIVVMPSQIPQQIADTGTLLNSDISTEIIENVFTPNTPLHDGAMLVSGNKIVAAGCVLPLTQDASVPKDLGTRHRAGIGITEMTDVLSIIVSEETGVISLVRRGVMRRYASAEMMTQALEEIYGIRSLNL